MTFAFGSNKVAPGEAVLSMSAQNNSGEVMVFKGEVDVETLNDGTVTLKEGQQLTISNDTEGKAETETKDIKATSLNEFQIKKMQSCSGDLCFTTAQLDKVVKDRKAEQEKQAKALEKEALAVVTKEKGGEQTTSKVMSCTIQIQCRTILSNMDKLKDGKGGYVPSNGVILATSRVEFQQGESAYDVTKRACSAAGIQMEASYSPVYGGYYVEGINHLYEFDCGGTSGWTYNVNGWSPNYGCSEYTLKDGDSIVWSYTCSRN
ncbi:MAG: DUF4430 domain-containing protein [Firmicutes bacterium]|nr:DUF4430 domain-containing protein [Bacillota bacterium]